MLARGGPALLALTLAPPCLCDAAETLQTVEKSADEWVKLRLETTRLRTAWQEERNLVEAMVAALNERAVAAEEKRDLTLARTSREREELEGLRKKIQTEGGELREFEAGLQELSARLLTLRPALPPRLSDALEMSFRSLADPALPRGERMQRVITLLNRCGQFNHTLTVGEEVLALGGNTPGKSLEVIYWGLSHAYAIDRAAHTAWLGRPREGTWSWEPHPEAFEAALQLISIASDKADPDFVVVPASVPRLLRPEEKR